MRRIAAIALLVLALALPGCARAEKNEDLPAPARVVDELLEARSEGETSTAVYKRLVESTEVAQALAEDSASRKKAPTPGWSTPEVVKESSSTADVEVEWKASDDFKEWPARTVFQLKRIDGRWLVAGAVEETASVEPTKTP